MSLLGRAFGALRGLFGKAGSGARPNHVPTQNTYIERRLRSFLVAAGLSGQFTQQFPLGPYRMDFGFPKVKLCVECDGEAWHSSPDQREKDRRRDAYMKKLGWVVLRYSGRDINSTPERCVQTVKNMVTRLATGWKPTWWASQGVRARPPLTPGPRSGDAPHCLKLMNSLIAAGIKVPRDLRLMAKIGL